MESITHLDFKVLHRWKALTACVLSLGGSAFSQTGTIADVQHVVIVMQENRSFDHYFGSLKGVRGFDDPNPVVTPDGSTLFVQRQGSSFVMPYGCTNQFLTDVDHTESSAIWTWNGGKWDQWLPSKGPASMAFFTRAELEFYYALADNYTVLDNYFCSVLGPTFPNRLYMMTGTIDPAGTGGGPVLTNGVPYWSLNWPTYPERLQSNGISWKVYRQYTEDMGLNPLLYFTNFMNVRPGDPLYDRGRALCTSVVSSFTTDVQSNILAKVCWVIPPWSFSEHPCNPPERGASFVKQLLDGLRSNSAVYNSTVFIVTYDENGGYFDHIPPPTPGPGTADEYVGGLPIGLGARVPMIIVSPWTRGGRVSSQVSDHTSILQFLERWTGVREPNLSSWRRQVCGDLTSAFDFQHPDTSYPSLPTPIPPDVCTNPFVPPIPSPQVMPSQEPGILVSRPLPYGPNANGFVDCTNQAFWLVLTNSGAASVHLTLYANSCRNDGPWQYDIPAGGTAVDCFAVTNSGCSYDFRIYGPKTFNRSFGGTPGSACGAEVNSSLNTNTGCISLLLQNSGTETLGFVISNALSPSPAINIPLEAGMMHTISIGVITNANSYDVTVLCTNDPAFRRRLAGELAIGPPVLSLSVLSGWPVLSYPAWAEAYGIEYSTSLESGMWSPEPQSPQRVNDFLVVPLDWQTGPCFFRLRRM